MSGLFYRCAVSVPAAVCVGSLTHALMKYSVYLVNSEIFINLNSKKCGLRKVKCCIHIHLFNLKNLD